MFEILLVLSIAGMSMLLGTFLAGPVGSICGGFLGVFVCLMAMVPGGFVLGVLLLVAAGIILSGHHDNLMKVVEQSKKDLKTEQNLRENLLGNLHKQSLKEIRFCWADWKHSVERGDTLDEIRHYKSRYLKSVAGVIIVLDRLEDEQRIVFWNWIFKTAMFDIPIGEYPHTEKFWDEEVLSEHLPEWTEELMA